MRDAAGDARCRPPRRSPPPGIEPVALAEKEGLALINGTDGMLGMLLLAVADLRPAAAHRRHHRGDERRGAARHRPRSSPPTCRRCARSPARRVGAANMRALLAGLADRRQPPRPGLHPRAGRLLAALRPAGRRRRPRHARPRRDWSPTASSPRPSTTRSSPSTAGSSPTATSTARRSATCWTSWPSPSPTWPRSPSGAPTGCSTWPARTGCRRSWPTTPASTPAT